MIESHVKAGCQDLMPGKELVYGLSITDACVGWEDTRKLVEDLADAVRQRRLKAEVEGEAE
jgi:3-deoxy-7-phosphoheptulonate synthase